MLCRRIEEASGYCGKCLKQVSVRRVTAKRWVLALAPLCGLWIILWVLDIGRIKSQSKWRCMKCGAEVYKIMEAINV
ncbi:MAG: hypothetical protein JW804_04275 [Sedimentisphaerales bacterium]|nr:hypothetical protein [Sedimentisphaerales bacterium]